MNKLFCSTFLREGVIVEQGGFTIFETKSGYSEDIDGRVEVFDVGEYYQLNIYEKEILTFSAAVKDIKVNVHKGIYADKDEMPIGDEYVEVLFIEIGDIVYKK